jgi:opacity protein-like surface antigen
MNKRIAFSILSMVLVLFAFASTSNAQDRRFHASLGGGATPLFDTLGDGFSTGWGPSLGVSFDISDRATLQFDYDYRYFSLKSDLDQAAGLYDANHKVNQLTFGFAANMTPSDSSVRPYVIGGPGFYHRKVEVTEYAGTGIICDPWIYLCGTYPIEEVVGSRGGWDFGVHFGAGVGFKFAEEAELFFEVRYHYVWGPETQPTATPVTSSTGPQNVNGQYLPITFGLRF